MEELIQQITRKHHKEIEVYAPASLLEIERFEQMIGFTLPIDFIEFYTTCNGFYCDEDLFRIIPLSEITSHDDDYGTNWFYFAEYMSYSDMWGLRHVDGQYEIFNGSFPTKAITSSLTEFLGRFLQGNVFEKGGLYDWGE